MCFVFVYQPGFITTICLSLHCAWKHKTIVTIQSPINFDHKCFFSTKLIKQPTKYITKIEINNLALYRTSSSLCTFVLLEFQNTQLHTTEVKQFNFGKLPHNMHLKNTSNSKTNKIVNHTLSSVVIFFYNLEVYKRMQSSVAISKTWWYHSHRALDNTCQSALDPGLTEGTQWQENCADRWGYCQWSEQRAHCMQSLGSWFCMLHFLTFQSLSNFFHDSVVVNILMIF